MFECPAQVALTGSQIWWSVEVRFDNCFSQSSKSVLRSCAYPSTGKRTGLGKFSCCVLLTYIRFWYDLFKIMNCRKFIWVLHVLRLSRETNSQPSVTKLVDIIMLTCLHRSALHLKSWRKDSKTRWRITTRNKLFNWTHSLTTCSVISPLSTGRYQVLAWHSMYSFRSRGITPKRVTCGGADLRDLAPGQHSSEGTSQRWRAVVNSISDLTGPESIPTPPSPIPMSQTTCANGLVCISLLVKNLRASRASKLPLQQAFLTWFNCVFRQNIMTICTIDVHNRDVVGKLIAEKVTSSQAFTWLSQLRHRWDDDEKHCYANICNAQFLYQYEYLGNTPRLVITPLTDRWVFAKVRVWIWPVVTLYEEQQHLLSLKLITSGLQLLLFTFKMILM